VRVARVALTLLECTPKVRHDAGDAFVDLALTLNGNLANAWGASGWSKTRLGAYDIGIKRAEFAMRLSPLDPRK
jgi:hypothetical protein